MEWLRGPQHRPLGCEGGECHAASRFPVPRPPVQTYWFWACSAVSWIRWTWEMCVVCGLEASGKPPSWRSTVCDLVGSARPCRGGSFEKEWWIYVIIMGYRSVWEMRKQWKIEVGRCIREQMSKWLLKCQWNDMKEPVHEWLCEWMKQTVTQSAPAKARWMSESMNEPLGESMTRKGIQPISESTDQPVNH